MRSAPPISGAFSPCRWSEPGVRWVPAAVSDFARNASRPVHTSPTVLRVRGYRFYFFSREERRPHVHVQHASGEAKIWLDPEVALAAVYGLSDTRAAMAVRIAKEHEREIRAAWRAHFEG